MSTYQLGRSHIMLFFNFFFKLLFSYLKTYAFIAGIVLASQARNYDTWQGGTMTNYELHKQVSICFLLHHNGLFHYRIVT